MKRTTQRWIGWLLLAAAGVCVAAAICTSAPAAPAKTDRNVADELQAISVTVRAEYAPGSVNQGSGVIVTRKQAIEGKDTEVNYIWTAGHVVERLRSVDEVIDPKTGTKRSVVKFKDAIVVQELRQHGNRVGELRMDAEVFRYSKDEDLAILRIRKTGFVRQSARFDLSPGVPALGTDLYHVGSPGGQEVGAHSTTPGIIAQVGRRFDGKLYDQTTVAALPGSSGGGVFKRTGECIGLLVLGLRGSDNFNYIVPIRRMRRWAKRAGVEWLLDSSVAVPAQGDLDKMPVEDSGVSFSGNQHATPPRGHKFHIYRLRNGKPVAQDKPDEGATP